MHLKSGSQNANAIIVHSVTTSKISHSHNINVTDLMEEKTSDFTLFKEWGVERVEVEVVLQQVDILTCRKRK